jgi:hypothetical protein
VRHSATTMPQTIDRTIIPVVAEAQSRLRLTQDMLATLARVSRRTVLRWYANKALPGPHNVTPIIAALHPQHRDLAAKLADHLGQTLAALGFAAPEVAQKAPPPAAPVPPATPPPPTARAFPPAELLVDSIVCAAAEALNTTPAAVRPIVRAAFARARGLGVSIREIDDALSPTPREATAAQAKPPASSSRKTK